MLAEVQTNRNSQLPASKNLLVLGTSSTNISQEIRFFFLFIFFFIGDKESGKTTLIAKIQGNEDPKKGAGLEYCYVDVRDEYRDGEKMRREREKERSERENNPPHYTTLSPTRQMMAFPPLRVCFFSCF